MIELFSIKETAKLFSMSPSRLRYWTQTGFVAPTVRRNGRLFYTFRDLINVKAAKELLAATGKTMDEARSSIDELRQRLPSSIHPDTQLSICSDGERIDIVEDDKMTRDGSALVVAFRVSSLATHIAETLKRPISAPPPMADSDDHPKRTAAPAKDKARPTLRLVESSPTSKKDDAAPDKLSDDPATEPTAVPTAYECFLSGYAAERRGEQDVASAWYLRALHLEPSMAAALTNLGNIHYQNADLAAARERYEQALEHDPEQAEARYNLGNLLDELGETDLAIAELRQVVSRHPQFADAHYNLGLILFRVGGIQQARAHLHRYLELDSKSEWSERANGFLEATAS